MKIGVVVQRYGPHFAGGAEYLAGIYARYLAKGNQVTVFTTCARDYHTWDNAYPEGISEEDGVAVHRFATVTSRDFTAFSQFSYANEINAFQLNPDDEESYFAQQGPLVPSLVDHLETSYHEYDAFIFFTYLYYPTVMGLPKVAAKSYLVATAHDEPPFYFLRTYAPLFHSLKGIIYLSEEEQRLINRTYKVPGNVKEIPGRFGLDEPPVLSDADDERLRAKYADILENRYFLYLGRASSTKNCLEMVHAFSQAKHKLQERVSLVFAGSMDLDLPERSDINYVGFVDEKEKSFLLRNALALVNPSPSESLSLVLLEAWNHGTPVIANGNCTVMKELIQESCGGLYYQSAAVFEALLMWCLTYQAEGLQLGEQGQQFVRAQYNWQQAYYETFRHIR